MRMKLLLLWIIFLTQCSRTNKVSISLISADQEFQFSEIDFLVKQVPDGYSLQNDLDSILRGNLQMPEHVITVKKHLFLKPFLTLDSGKEYIVSISGIMNSTHRVSYARHYPIFKNRANEIAIYGNFDPALRLEPQSAGREKEIHISWTTFPQAKFYLLSVEPRYTILPQPPASLSCFVKGMNSLRISDCYANIHNRTKEFNRASKMIMASAKTAKLSPGTYDVIVTAWTFDSQVSEYISMNDPKVTTSVARFVITP
jgi:hypothetical protein